MPFWRSPPCHILLKAFGISSKHLKEPHTYKNSCNSSNTCQKICSWSRSAETILEIWKKTIFLEVVNKPIIYIFFKDTTIHIKNTKRAVVLEKGGIIDLPLLRISLAICHGFERKSMETETKPWLELPINLKVNPARDLSRKFNHLNKLVWDYKQSLPYLSVLWEKIKQSNSPNDGRWSLKDKYISRRDDWENLIYDR